MESDEEERVCWDSWFGISALADVKRDRRKMDGDNMLATPCVCSNCNKCSQSDIEQRVERWVAKQGWRLIGSCRKG